MCARCAAHPPGYTALRSWAAFTGPLRQALHRLKYCRDLALGEALARHLIALWDELDWNVDLVVSVPLSDQRLAQRGYNQAALLARPFALALGLRFRPGALSKSRDTASQVGLSLEQRRENVLGAFRAKSEYVQEKRVLVLDDVATSGSTLDACTQALLEAGARQVYCLTLARAASPGVFA